MDNINFMYNIPFSGAVEEKSKEKSTYFEPRIILAEFLPLFQIYQTWFYEIWPVLSVAKLTASVSSADDICKMDLNPGNIQSYTLCCALAGAIKQHIQCVSSSEKNIRIPEAVKNVDFIGECVRARNFYDYRSNPTIESVLVSFFLHVYYSSVKLNSSAILYLREAIAIAELLGLNDESKYKNVPQEENHLLRNIYYILVVAERFTSLEADFTVLLDANIPYDTTMGKKCVSAGDLSPIVKVFALPGKSFFLSRVNSDDLSHNFSENIVTKIQEELSSIEAAEDTSDTQKLNIILSKSWMQQLVWNLYNANRFPNFHHKSDCFSSYFPIKIARDFLASTQRLPFYSFETNGPCVSTKLLAVAEGVSDIINEDNFSYGYDTLSSLVGIISRLGHGNRLPPRLQQKLHRILNSECHVPKFLTGTQLPEIFFESPSKIELLKDNDNPKVESSSKPDENVYLHTSNSNELFRWPPFMLPAACSIYYNATPLRTNYSENSLYQGTEEFLDFESV